MLKLDLSFEFKGDYYNPDVEDEYDRHKDFSALAINLRLGEFNLNFSIDKIDVIKFLKTGKYDTGDFPTWNITIDRDDDRV